MDESTRWIRHPDSMRHALLSALLPTLVLFILAPAVGDAQVPVVTNITSSGLGTEVPLLPPSDGVYNITGGARPGGGLNLFHSFGDFSIGQGDVANFFNDSGLPTSNILGRVTGGNISSIDGTIRTTGFDNANLFLVNPSGIIFGPHGSFDVGGSVSFSTAQYLRLFDGLNSANFYADLANNGLDNSVFAMAPLVDFGFLSPAGYGFLDVPDPSATITVQGSTLSILPTPDGFPRNSISLIGGNVVIEGGAQLSAPSGSIHLATSASPGEFAAFEPLANATSLQSLPNNPVDPASAVSFASYGSVSLAPGSSIDVSGAKTVFLIGGQLVLSVNDATLNTSENPAPSDAVSLSPGSSILTSNSGTDPGADVQMTVENLTLDSAAITTENLGDGIGGSVTAHVGALSLANIASLNSNNSSFRIGDDGSFIIGIGQGGKLTIQGRAGADSVADSVMLSNGSSITTQTFSSKPGGGVVIAAEDVHLDASTISTTMLGPGGGGDVHITANFLTIENGSTVTTGTSFLGEVGENLFLNVGTLRLLGGEFGGSQIQSVNGSGDLDGDGFPDVFGLGKGGNITIQGTTQGANSAADLVVLSGSSGITSGAQYGSGAGGQISIRATSLDLKETSGITSSTNTIGTDMDGDGVLDDLTAGAGGDIVVAVQNLRVLEGSTIASSTLRNDTLAVAGGTVTVEGLDAGSKASSVLLSGQDTRIVSSSAFGLPGDLTVNAETLTITNGAVINTGSALLGPAGNVGITAGSVAISAGGQIVSRTATQNAGQVTITADSLNMDNGSIVTSTASEIGGRGGDVVLNGGTVSLTNGARINSQSETFSTGRAGDIKMNHLESLVLSNHAEITSSSKGIREIAGDAGNVAITSSGSFTSNASTIATSAENARGGDIDITAQTVELSNGTLISASSRSPLLPNGEGNAGNVTITSASNVIMQNSSVTTEASRASGGEITINAADSGMVQMTNSKVITSVAGSDGDTSGGDISIDPQFVILQNSQILAQAFAGTGGNINIISNVFLSDPLSVVSATSQLGISGTVNINAPVQNVSGELVVLSQDFASAAALLAQQCAARVADGKFSTFVVAAREGLPVEPGGFLPSSSFLTELGGSALSRQLLPIPPSAGHGLLLEYDTEPIQLAKLVNACRR